MFTFDDLQNASITDLHFYYLKFDLGPTVTVGQPELQCWVSSVPVGGLMVDLGV